MSEKIKLYFLAHRFFYTLPMLVVAIMVGAYLSFFFISQVDATVSDVTLADTDTMGYGLDGRDFSIDWSVVGEAPVGYQGTYIYILPADLGPYYVVSGTIEPDYTGLFFYNVSDSLMVGTSTYVRSTGPDYPALHYDSGLYNDWVMVNEAGLFDVVWTSDGVGEGAVLGTYSPSSSASGIASISLGPNELNSLNINAICNSNPAQPRGFMPNYSAIGWQLPDFFGQDSCGVNFSTSTSYVAWIMVDADTDYFVSSTPVNYISAYDTPEDNNAPNINHLSVHTAIAGNSAIINAIVRDDQTLTTQFASTTDGGSDFFKLFYGTDVSVSENSVDGVLVEDSLFQFTIPSGQVPSAGQTFEYYLVAADANGNEKLICNNFQATTSTDCQAQPFVVNVVSGASVVSISGNVQNGWNNTNLVDAKVFVGGLAKEVVTTNMSGNYTISGVPQNNGYDITVVKSDFCEIMRMENVSNVNLTNVDFILPSGSCGFFGGEGDGGNPRVMFSGPPDGSSYVPIIESIRVGFNQAMDASTINDANPTDVGSNIYLTTDDGTTKIAGQVLYCETASSPGCSVYNPPPEDTNFLIFDPTNNLATSTFYTLVMSGNVKAMSGMSLEGNRQLGGHKISFSTEGGFDVGQIGTNFGQGGAYMPPFVRSMVPSGMGSLAFTNTRIFLEFNEPMKSDTITSSNIKLFKLGLAGNDSEISLTSVTLDSNYKKFVKIVPASTLAEGQYEIRIKSPVANSSGITMGPPDNPNMFVFFKFFEVGISGDTTGPVVYPALSNNSTGVDVNKVFEFGFNEALDFTTVNNTNITMYRGSTAVSISVNYDVAANTLFIIPQSSLAPNTQYSINLGTSIKDAANNPLSSTQAFTYTTGGADTVAPKLYDVRCDDFKCNLQFSEPMNSSRQVDSGWSISVLNSANYSLTVGVESQSLASALFTYDNVRHSVNIENLQISAEQTFTISASSTAIKDLSGNFLDAGSNSFSGVIENSSETFGMFGDIGMFGPPKAGMVGGEIGGVFKPEGFGSFTGEQFFNGQATMAHSFNSMASMDSNVFQIKFTPSTTPVAGQKIQVTFPSGTNVVATSLDTYSPFYQDMNENRPGMVTSTAITADSSSRKVTVTLGVGQDSHSGSVSGHDPLVLDLRGIINPSIPKGPESGGYTVDVKLLDASNNVLLSQTSMPYYIMGGGSNNITVNLKLHNADSPDLKNANVFLFGGGPAGPMDKPLTIVNGVTSTQYTNLPDGCYHVGTEPLIIATDDSEYYGQSMPEPICVSGGQSITKTIIFSRASGEGANVVPITVKFIDSEGNPYNFGGKDIDIFAGGPGRFVVKTLSNISTSDAGGYIVNLPVSGFWHVGMGPAMPKSGGKPVPLEVMPPPPVELNVNIGGGNAVSLAGGLPPSSMVSFVDGTDTVVFRFPSVANKITVSGVVKDGADNPIPNVEVFMHQQGFGMPVHTQTNALGQFTLGVYDYGSYEIGSFKDGLPPTFKQIEIRQDGNDDGVVADIYLNGTQVSSVILRLKKPDYYISGKVLDSSGNGIGYAPVFANNINGDFVGGGTDSSGNYTLYVSNGTWTVKSELPPDKTDTCGTFSKSVVVNGSNMTNQNISPTAGSCYILSGTVTLGGSTLTNAPIHIEEWNIENNRPSGGFGRGASTDSNGNYSVKVGNGTYRVGTWHPDYGEVGDIVVVSGDNATKDITVAYADLVFDFTGGSSGMQGFLEIKNNTDKTKRIGKAINDLSATTSIKVQSGQNYKYFVDVFGVGKFEGTISNATNGQTVTVNLGINSSDFITVTGTIKDESDNNLSGALVTFVDATNNVIKTAVADSNGDYSINIKAGTYDVGASLGNYVPGEAASSVIFTTNTSGHSFGSGEEHVALQVADKTIAGNVNLGGSAVDEGYVWAVNNDTGVVVKAPVEPSDGSYILPVTDGAWTVKAAAAGASETTLGTAVNTTLASQTGKNIALTVDGTKTKESASGSVSGSTGGSVDDTDSTGIKLTAGAGVLQTGSGNVTLNLEKSFNAPDSEAFQSLSNATFEIGATGNSTIKNLNGNVEIQLDYSSLVADLPSGVSESDLQMMYYSPERGDYVPVEGGFTIDPTNNTVTGLVNHFTEFVLAYVPPATSPSPSPGGGGSVDVTPPSNVSVAIVNSAASTTSTSVNLVLGATGANYMMISNFSDFTDGVWVSYTTSKLWAITTGNGLKTIYAKFKDNSNNVSAVVSTTITLADQVEDQKTEEEQKAEVEKDLIVSCSLTMEKAYRHKDARAIFYVTDECTKRPFNKANIFFTYFDSWDDVIVLDTMSLLNDIPNDKLGFMPWGHKYDPKYGALVKIVSDPKVYLLLGNKKYWITSEEVFNSLKYSWNWIEDVATKLLDKYISAGEIATTTYHPNYTLVKYKNSAKVYRLEPDTKDTTKQVKRHIKNETAFNALNFRWDRIVTIDDTEEYADGEDLGETSTHSGKYQFKLNLSVGDTNEDVRQLQLKLKGLGYFTYPNMTGYYGAATAEAVREFQIAKGISALGIVGPQTRAVLNSL